MVAPLLCGMDGCACCGGRGCAACTWAACSLAAVPARPPVRPPACLPYRPPPPAPAPPGAGRGVPPHGNARVRAAPAGPGQPQGECSGHAPRAMGRRGEGAVSGKAGIPAKPQQNVSEPSGTAAGGCWPCALRLSPRVCCVVCVAAVHGSHSGGGGGGCGGGRPGVGGHAPRRSPLVWPLLAEARCAVPHLPACVVPHGTAPPLYRRSWRRCLTRWTSWQLPGSSSKRPWRPWACKAQIFCTTFVVKLL